MNIVIIKRYNSPSEAYLDASLLKDNEIECAVNGENLINVMPLVGDQVTLSVREQDEQRAKELLLGDSRS